MDTDIIAQVEEAVFDNSLKHANTGKVGSYNQLKRMTFGEEPDGTVVVNVFSQKISAPGYSMRFSPEDWGKFKRTVRRFGDKQKNNGKNKK